MTRVLVFGATSAIAHAVARTYAAEGAHFFLVARNAQRLVAAAADLRVRGAGAVDRATADLADASGHAALVDRARAALGGVDVVLVAYGTLSDQAACVRDSALATCEISVNFLSAVSLLTDIANVLEAQRGGTVAVIGSVAGDRGRRTNYVYGSAKAGLGVFVEGLRHRLARYGVRVVLVKPGFVDTPMTAGLPKGGMLWARPETVARDIRRGIERDTAVVYTPWFWRWIMRVIRGLPDAVFQRLSI